jgi:hypothetical protein
MCALCETHIPTLYAQSESMSVQMLIHTKIYALVYTHKANAYTIQNATLLSHKALPHPLTFSHAYTFVHRVKRLCRQTQQTHAL